MAAFVEKPQLERAQEMLDAGGYYWNSGTFMMPRDVFVAECERLAPGNERCRCGGCCESVQ